MQKGTLVKWYDDYVLKLRLCRLFSPVILHGSSKGLRFQAVEKTVDGRRTGEQKRGQRGQFRVIVEMGLIADTANLPKNQATVWEIKQIQRANQLHYLEN